MIVDYTSEWLNSLFEVEFEQRKEFGKLLKDRTNKQDKKLKKIQEKQKGSLKRWF